MCVLCCCFIVSLCVTALASGLLPPRNVQLTSHNMDLYLRWKPPENVSSQILYSTKLQRRFDSVQASVQACVNTSALFCELSAPSLDLKILEFGQYSASVRALSGNEVSDWVHSQPLTMDKDTVIGPPTVAVVSHEADLEVSVRDPEFRVSSVSSVFGLPKYNITYWPRGRPHQALHMLVQQSRVVLNNLEPLTEYCIQVQINVTLAKNQNIAETSEPVCESTADGLSCCGQCSFCPSVMQLERMLSVVPLDAPPAPWVTALVTFVALVLAVALVAVTAIYHKRICHFLCPKDSLPQPLQNLPECPDLPRLQEEPYHPLTMIPGQDEGERLTADS